MWAVVLTFDQPEDEETLILWEDKLDGPAVSGIPGKGFMVTAHESGTNPLKALNTVVDDVSATVGSQPVRYEVMREEDFEAAASEPTLPELASAGEAAKMLRVSRQRVHQLHSQGRNNFPAPVYELSTGPLWTRDAIEWFARTWDRTPGRRPKARASQGN